MSKLPDLQAAVRRLEGVQHATVRWPDPGGPAILRVEFAEDANRAAVTDEVVATLRDLAGVNIEDLHVESAGSGSATGSGSTAGPVVGTPVSVSEVPDSGSADPVRRTRRSAPEPPRNGSDDWARPVFRGMTIDRGELDTAIEVTLGIGPDSFRGRAEGLATLRETPRTAASATLTALHDLLPDDVRVQLDWLEVVEGSGPRRPDIVHSAVTCLSRNAEETFVGSAIVRSDLREAAVRATLDALNRRLERFAAVA